MADDSPESPVVAPAGGAGFLVASRVPSTSSLVRVQDGGEGGNSPQYAAAAGVPAGGGGHNGKLETKDGLVSLDVQSGKLGLYDVLKPIGGFIVDWVELTCPVSPWLLVVGRANATHRSIASAFDCCVRVSASLWMRRVDVCV
jgi:hypothetical protein